MTEQDFEKWMEAVCRDGVSFEDSQKAYDGWASTYDLHATSAKHDINSKTVANILEQFFPASERGLISVIDVGAGTGLVAKELKKLGFEHLDALEPSSKMLDEAKKNNLYENNFVECITGSPTSLPANSYDVLTGSGIYAIEAHVPTEAFYEMIRLVKPGGYIVLVGNYSQIRASKNYENFEPLMKRLEVERKWKKLIHEVWTADSVGTSTVERLSCCYQVL
ncbi:uncharacterized protein LOC132718041 [Ruditapes philippinarum]|uniref:uncharacterized protein LOC132718041 n=1 Tax=Ruditapes philippinarum TaxID=129788 RepID=UPI00295B873B|nr:uncharacterized protein LOC132718041 [Ruditapes philippinarum]